MTASDDGMLMRLDKCCVIVLQHPVVCSGEASMVVDAVKQHNGAMTSAVLERFYLRVLQDDANGGRSVRGGVMRQTGAHVGPWDRPIVFEVGCTSIVQASDSLVENEHGHETAHHDRAHRKDRNEQKVRSVGAVLASNA